jgi:parallel beta-helix repeat protein
MTMNELDALCGRRTVAMLIHACALILLALLSFDSRAETITGWGISSLPYTITNSGHYHLTKNFNHFSLSSPAAITISLKDSANDVVLDLNDHTITAANINQSYGVVGSTTGTGSITVRNGTLRGFVAGVFITGQGALIENMTVISPTLGFYNLPGIYVVGANGTVRNNVVIGAYWGIYLADGSGMRAVNNDVSAASSDGIRFSQCDQSIAENNRLSDCTSFGIGIENSQNVLIVNSRITSATGAGFGIDYYNGSTGKFRDNFIIGVGTAYSGGTNAGNNQ